MIKPSVSLFATTTLVLVLLVGCSNLPFLQEVESSTPTRPATPVTASAKRIQAHMAILADDDMEGREAGTRGYVKAAQYVADEMAKLGVSPAGDEGTYFQQVPLLTFQRDLEQAVLEVEVGGKTHKFEPGEDFLIGTSPKHAETDIKAEAVFVGYGIEAPEFGINDFEGLDVTGKIAVVLMGTPADLPNNERAHLGNNKLSTLQEKGAIGYIRLYTTQGEKRRPWSRVKTYGAAKAVTWVNATGEGQTTTPGLMASATLSPKKSALLFDGAEKSYADILAEADKKDGKPSGFALPAKIRIAQANTYARVESSNVVGLIEGSDPELKHEYIVLTAHLDHIGISNHVGGGHDTDQKPGAKDIINNGALDNAAGVATTLEVARKFLEAKKQGKGPRRSILVVMVTAEEKGLIGSDYFAQNPTVEKSAMVANVNLDMPLLFHNFVDVIAFGADRSSLGPTVEKAAASMNVKLMDDPMPEMSLFTRSDHYSFVKQGIPAVFLILGFGNGGEEKFKSFLGTEYHSPADQLDLPIDYEQGARFTELNYRIARALANEDIRPHWNEGDFFGELYGQ